MPQTRPFMLKLGQEEFAELTGLTRATVNTCLSALEAKGALQRRYDRLEMTDIGALRSAAEG